MALKFEDIKGEFLARLESDRRAAALMSSIESGTATYATVTQYAERVGEALGYVLRFHAPIEDISEWDIDDLIPRSLGLDHRIVVNACRQVQEAMNRDAGVGISFQEPKFDGERAYGIVEELRSNPEFINIEETFYDQISNFSQSVVDSSVRANAAVASGAGIKTWVIRTASSGACKWCRSVAGKYNYEDVKGTGDDVWRRHENCNCTIDYVTERNGSTYRERVYEGGAEIENTVNNIENDRMIDIRSSSSDRRDLSYLYEGRAGLTAHEQSVLDRVSESGSYHEFEVGYVTENDMSRISAYTHHEFALWRSKNHDILFHGDSISCNPPADMESILMHSYEWVAHTHVDRGPLVPSPEDRRTLVAINQHSSLLLGVDGTRRVFYRDEFDGV